MENTPETISELSPEQIISLLTQGVLGDNSDTITLVVEVTGVMRNLKCRRIGLLNEKYSLVSYPTMDDHLIHIKVGQTLEFKIFDGMEFVNGLVSIHRVFFNPEPFLIIEHINPKKNLRQKIRSATRVAANIPVSIKLPQDTQITAIAADISKTGAMLLLDSALPDKHKKLNLVFEIEHNNHQHIVEINAIVRRNKTTEMEDGTIYTLSVQFEELTPFADLCISNYIRGEVCKRIN